MQTLLEGSALNNRNFMDYALFSKPLCDLPSQPLLINTINQYSFCMAHNDSQFKKSLLESDVLLPDGIAVVIATRFLTGQKIQKIAGADIHQHMLEELNAKGGSCFYLGSADETLRKIKERVAREYPNVRVGSYSPPYKAQFSEGDNQKMLDAVNNFAPQVLFVGMTAPKQEKWVSQHKSSLNSEVICTIGAVFDFYAGTIQRPSKIWVDMGLEWFVRLVKEPKRMWRRYVYYGPVFLYHIMKHKMRYHPAQPKSEYNLHEEMVV